MEWTPVWLLVWLVVAVGSCVQASVGIGLGLLAAPILALIAPELVPGPMLASVFSLTVFVLLRERRAVRLGGLGWALAGRLPGTLLGAVVVAAASARATDLALGGLLLACVAMSAWSERTVAMVRGGGAADGEPVAVAEPPRPILFLAGALSGLSGTATGVGGPPVALALRRYPTPSLRATMGGFFLVGVTLSLAALASVGEFGRTEMRSAAMLLPAIAVGAALSNPLRRFVDGVWARRSVLVLSGAAALLVLLRGLGLG